MKQVEEIPHSNTFGYWFNEAPADQSTCDHLCDEMKKHCKVRFGRCDFYEPFGDTHSWRVVDVEDIFGPTNLATYYVAVWLRPDTSGKFGVAIGTWKEDFWTPYPKGKVSQCAADTGDYSEKKTLAENDPVMYQSCDSSEAPPTWVP